jgi:hypothetical protein
LPLQHLLPRQGGHFPPESGGQFPAESVVSFPRNQVVNFSEFSNKTKQMPVISTSINKNFDCMVLNQFMDKPKIIFIYSNII